MAGFMSKSFIRMLVLAALSQLLVVSGARKRMSVEKHQAKPTNAARTPEDTPDVFGALGTEDEVLAEQDIDRSSLKKPYVAEDHDLSSMGFDALLAHHKAHGKENTPEAGSGQINKDVSEDIDEDAPENLDEEHDVEDNESPDQQGKIVDEDPVPVVEVEDEDVVQDNADEINDAEGTPSNLDESTLENEEGDVSLDDVEDEKDKQLPVVTETISDEEVPEVITSVPELPPTQENEDLNQDAETDEHLAEVTDKDPVLENDEESDPIIHDATPEVKPNTACGHQDAPHVFHTITIGGFPDMIGGYNRSSLNADYAEVACDPISGRETYWKGKAGPLLFYCKSQNVWLVSMPEYLPQAREGNCIGFARGAIGKDILAPEFMPFNRTYNHEISGWQNLTEVAVTAVTVQDSP